jgi:hypothetical protein
MAAQGKGLGRQAFNDLTTGNKVSSEALNVVMPSFPGRLDVQLPAMSKITQLLNVDSID